ncbi:hypothetical protein [Alteromonas gilva]|uniref:Uncharacterized protein n=1 Tax=Alteromonas gilva TaxID=2987522 RepID=A0ABT5L029_9ALTE|nr:hypothetical protein [Alteromonas gilva]MDC8830237.1 hypothetical protein [Alteromonas gilva]
MIPVLIGIGVGLMLCAMLVLPYLKPAKFNPYLFYSLSLLTVISLFIAQEYVYALVLLAVFVVAGMALRIVQQR